MLAIILTLTEVTEYLKANRDRIFIQSWKEELRRRET